jgi:hypothetical protein
MQTVIPTHGYLRGAHGAGWSFQSTSDGVALGSLSLSGSLLAVSRENRRPLLQASAKRDGQNIAIGSLWAAGVLALLRIPLANTMQSGASGEAVVHEIRAGVRAAHGRRPT